MRMLVLIFALVGLAAAGRLDNTYLPPASASQAGGQNLGLPIVQQRLEQQQQTPVVAPSNTYLPPVNNFVTEAKLHQTPKPLGGSGILRQQGLQSTLGSGAPAPLRPQTSSFSSQQLTQATFSSQPASLPQIPQISTFSSGPSYSSLPSSSSASSSSSSQQISSLSFGSQQASAPSTFSQQSSFPKTSGFSSGFQQSAFSGQQQASANFNVKTSASFNNQQQLSQSGVRQGGFSQASAGQPVAILKSINVNNGDGTYSYSYETENGIEAQEQGELRQGRDGGEAATVVQGGFAFTAPDTNARYTVTYTADENGFRAYGEHLPTPPPIPEAILRSIEFNAREQEAQNRLQQQQGYQYQQPQQDLPQVVDQRQQGLQQQGFQSSFQQGSQQGFQSSPFQQKGSSLSQSSNNNIQTSSTSTFQAANNGGYQY